MRCHTRRNLHEMAARRLLPTEVNGNVFAPVWKTPMQIRGGPMKASLRCLALCLSLLAPFASAYAQAPMLSPIPNVTLERRRNGDRECGGDRRQRPSDRSHPFPSIVRNLEHSDERNRDCGDQLHTVSVEHRRHQLLGCRDGRGGRHAEHQGLSNHGQRRGFGPTPGRQRSGAPGGHGRVAPHLHRQRHRSGRGQH